MKFKVLASNSNSPRPGEMESRNISFQTKTAVFNCKFQPAVGLFNAEVE